MGSSCQWAGICPIVKRVWTSSYTLYSGGWILLILAGLYALMEWKGWQRWAFPLVVVGMNSIAIYVMSWTMTDFFGNALNPPLWTRNRIPGGTDLRACAARSLSLMLIFWCILFWMYRRKLFFKI